MDSGFIIGGKMNKKSDKAKAAELELEDTMQYIYNFWLDAGIVLHKTLNDRTKSRIKSALKNYSVEGSVTTKLGFASSTSSIQRH